jgi:hypothetical protein
LTEDIATLPERVATEWSEIDAGVTVKALRARTRLNPPGSYNAWLAADNAMRRRMGWKKGRP